MREAWHGKIYFENKEIEYSRSGGSFRADWSQPPFLINPATTKSRQLGTRRTEELAGGSVRRVSKHALLITIACITFL